MPSRFVRVLGVGLTVTGCHSAAPPEVNPLEVPPPDVVVNPPSPTVPEVAPVVVRNPPPPQLLPTWESVLSGHPEGATNPPSPVLIVARASGDCFKDWRGGMMRLPEDVRRAGGMVVATIAEATGTQVQCPEGEPARLIAAWDAVPAGGSAPK